MAAVLLPVHATPASDERGIRVVAIADAQGQPVLLYEESHALIVGVSNYSAGWPSLPAVEKDVEEIRGALEAHGFDVEVVSDPSRDELYAAYESFINRHGQGAENRLLFYFAGHGFTERLTYGEDMGYVVPADAPNPHRDSTGFRAKAMDMVQMEVFAKRIQSKHALFLFDSCFSGSIFSLSRAVPTNIGYKTAKPVRQFITSGSADEQVPDRSIFRQQLVSALEGKGDLDGDGFVTGTELGEFLQTRVVNYSRGAQHPQYGKIRSPHLDEGDFVFALPSGVEGGRALAEAPKGQSAATEPVDEGAFELTFWRSIEDSGDPAGYRAYLAQYPQGRFSKLAKLRAQPPHETAPSAMESDSARDISRWLLEADHHRAANRLTQPAGNSAVDLYRKILAVEPENAAAHSGLRKIGERYLELAQLALRKGDRAKAQLYTERGLRVAPEHRELGSFQQELASRPRSESQQTPLPTAGRAEAELSGTWQSIEGEILVITGMRWETYEEGDLTGRGTYAVRGNQLITNSASGESQVVGFSLEDGILTLSDRSAGSLESYVFFRQD